MSEMQSKLKKLFQYLAELDEALLTQDDEKFRIAEMRFSDGLRNLLDSNKDHLEDLMEDLLLLKETSAIIQKKAQLSLSQLREQTLQHKRNKNKIKAYGKNT